jgi:hypothetical protein
MMHMKLEETSKPGSQKREMARWRGRRRSKNAHSKWRTGANVSVPVAILARTSAARLRGVTCQNGRIEGEDEKLVESN